MMRRNDDLGGKFQLSFRHENSPEKAAERGYSKEHLGGTNGPVPELETLLGGQP